MLVFVDDGGNEEMRRDPKYVMVAYRQYILGKKKLWNLQRCSNGKPIAKRICRALVHYRGYVDGYLEAKREYLAIKRLESRNEESRN